MKKTFITIAIVSALLAMFLAGCRAATPMPTPITPYGTPMATLPYVSPSPLYGVTTMPGVSFTPMPTVSVGTSVGAT